jgi:ribonuclease-3
MGEAPFDEVARSLGHDFADPRLLREALTHPSTGPHQRGEALHGYERLEFLGDRVLGLVIAEWLLERFPAEPEGSLARRFSALVRGETLGEVAHEAGLGPHLVLSPSEEAAGGRENPAILADVCEALIAALYLDGGLKAARRFIRGAFAGVLEGAVHPPQEPKTVLQEWAQARGLALPRYEVVARSGPDHDPVFSVRVEIEGLEGAVGEGASKRLAEKAAAAAFLARLDRT